MQTPLQLLNNLTPTQFLRDYWQKKPLLIKNAIPDFQGLLSPEELAGLACEADVQARIIQFKNKQWLVRQSPFVETDFTTLPEHDWTLLVQSVNHFLPEAAELLAQFNFIPHARLDDLMVSYAPKGGGVGPHVDSYDVFLLQGSGKRRWKISSQNDLTLIESAPLKVLKNFNAEHEWVLEAGDMLYLPPQIAHWGTAEDNACMTYSIGFRAPKTQELMHAFLNYLQDNLHADGLYQDADLLLQNHPAEISRDMVKKVESMLKKMTWQTSDVADFLGCYLSEPKPDVFFEHNKKISPNSFAKKIAKHPLKLALKSQLLFYQLRFYLNGELLEVPENLIESIRYLADYRTLDSNKSPVAIQHALAELLYASYLAGFIEFN